MKLGESSVKLIERSTFIENIVKMKKTDRAVLAFDRDRQQFPCIVQHLRIYI